MVDIQTVSIAIASASVALVAIYNAFQVKHQSKVRQTELVTKLYSIYASEGFQKDWHVFMEEETNDYNTYRKKYARDSSNSFILY
jgi:ribosomal protein S8